MKIVFAGDLFLGGDLINFDLSDAIKVDAFHKADLRILNLEHPISDSEGIAKKSALYVGTSVLHSLKTAKIGAVSLANNHIHDKLEKGIEDTIYNLKNINIQSFGAGMNIKSAREP